MTKHHSITDTFVEKAKSPTTGELFYRDRAIRGFGLRVNWGGTKSYILEGRLNGRVRRMTLGRWPELPVVRARKKALEWKSVIAEGKDPTAPSPGEQSTFEALSSRYLEHVRAHGKKSVQTDERNLARYVPKGWAKRRLVEFTRDDMIRLHESVGAEHGHVTANRLIALLRPMFNAAIDDWKLLAGANPAARIKFFHEEKRERFLSPEELERVNLALLEEANAYWRAYFPLVCMLGTRRSELLMARWADVDLEGRTWLLPHTKAGRSHLLPLPQAALAILSTLPSRGKSEWVFPGNGRTGHLTEPKFAWARIRTRAGVPDVRIHDLRRTLGSWLAAAGHGLPLIGKALNHQSPSSTAIYARLSLDPVRVMLEQNATAMFGAPDENARE